MIPGSNLLKQALSVISSISVTYKHYTGRTANALGLWVATYSSSTVRGSLQPVPKSSYQEMGLDLEKSYFTFYASTDFIAATRDVSGDQIVFQGKLYQCLNVNSWYAIDGWTGVVIELIGAAP